MGFRLEIIDMNLPISAGDDHKLYGYISFEDVSSSFIYLFPFMKRQWVWTDGYDLPSEVYDMLCNFSETEYLRLSHEEFRRFSKLYLHDLAKVAARNDSYKEAYDHAKQYFKVMGKLKGGKMLQWE